tara:strand:+ start:418 stop:522 length:105 start_codon:yes stop_codon:yes gene_type:complete
MTGSNDFSNIKEKNYYTIIVTWVMKGMAEGFGRH